MLFAGCDLLSSDSNEKKEEFVGDANHQAAREEALAHRARILAQHTDALNGTDIPRGESGGPVDNSLAGVHFLHTNVSRWPITSNLASARVSSGNIVLNYDKANAWPGVQAVGETVNANPWILVSRGGKWYAATFEWFRPGQTSKPIRTVNGDHIKSSPLNDFVPVSGEMYGFFVSGLARGSERNVKERSNIKWLVWP